MRYLVVLGRQPEISRAELEAQGARVGEIYFSGNLALAEVEFEEKARNEASLGAENAAFWDIRRFGGVQKMGVLMKKTPLEVLSGAPEGKITFGISEFVVDDDENARKMGEERKNANFANREALKWKRKLLQQGRSVRVVPNKTGVISTATSLHNGLSGRNPRKFEFLLFRGNWYQVTGVQDIDAYAKRDQKRPARDAKIGMLPPKLAQVMINLAGALPPQARILDPFCGTGVVLQEALLLGFRAYGSDLDPRMVEYARKNLEWLLKSPSQTVFRGRTQGRELRSASRAAKPTVREKGLERRFKGNEDNSGVSFEAVEGDTKVIDPDSSGELLGNFDVVEGDATDFRWEQPIDAVVTEGYLGRPFSTIPTGIEVKKEILEVKALILRFLKNLAGQIEENTPVVMAMPAWLRQNGEYLRLNMLDSIGELGYNVENNALIYHREGQIVARDIIILRKK